MLKVIIFSALALSVIGQQIGATNAYSCQGCQLQGGYWCQGSTASFGTCYRNATVPTTTCAAANWYTSPGSCPGVSQCTQLATGEAELQGVARYTYTIGTGTFCVVGVSSMSDDAVSVTASVSGVSSLFIARDNNTNFSTLQNITNDANAMSMVDYNMTHYFFIWYQGAFGTASSLTITLTLEGGFEEDCIGAAEWLCLNLYRLSFSNPYPLYFLISIVNEVFVLISFNDI